MGPKIRIPRKDRLFSAIEVLQCKLCQIRVRTENLKRHLLGVHSAFLKHRSKVENTNIQFAVQITYHNHVVKNSEIPTTLIDWYNQSKITSFFKLGEKGSDVEKVSDINNKQVEQPNIESSKMQCMTDDTIKERKVSESISGEELIKNLKVSSIESEKIGVAISPSPNSRPNIDVKDVHQEVKLEVNSIESEKIGVAISPSPNNTVNIDVKDVHQGVTDSPNSVSKSDLIEVISKPRVCNYCKQMIKGKQLKELTGDVKTKQLKLYQHCLACERIKIITQVFLSECKEALDVHCKCGKDNCCCKAMLDESLQTIKNKIAHENFEEKIQSFSLKTRDDKVDLNQHFFSLRDKQGDLRWYCHLCYKHSPKVKYTRGGQNDWVIRGWKNPHNSKLRESMKYHLRSDQHSVSKSIYEKSHTKSSLEANVKFKDLQAKCTENFCLAGLFLALNYLPGRFYTEMVEFIDKILTNIYFGKEFTHPLGNQHQSKMASCIAQIAAYEAIRAVTLESNGEINPNTGISRRFTLACDKGTAPKDSTRQVIVETHINAQGKYEERLVTAAICGDATAKGAATHFKTYVEKVLNCSNIVAICTDGASVYVGHERGMIARLKSDLGLGAKLIELPDLNHKLERLMFHNKPQWFVEALSQSGEIVNHIRQHPTINRFLINAEAQTGKHYHAVTSMVQTRFTEYGSHHIQSVLKNIEILLEGLPALLNSDQEAAAEFHAIRILNLISDRKLMAQLLLMDNIFVEIGICEKQAQAKAFSPFDYIHIVNKLRSVFQQELLNEYENVTELLKSGKLNYSYRYKGHDQNVCIDLNQVEVLLYKYWKSSRHVTYSDVIPSYRDWIVNILEDFDNFLVIPPAINLSYKVFCNDEQSLKDKVALFRDFFSMVNTEFKECSDTCDGILTCPCIYSEFSRFFDHFINLQKDHREKFKKKSESTNILEFYLNIQNVNVVKRLNIFNVVRAIEITMLLKASQSNTERVMSVVSRIVRGRFENVYRIKKTDTSHDMVNIQTALRMNGDLVSFDSSLARQKLLRAGHREALMSSKSRYKKSKTLRTRKLFEKEGKEQVFKKPHLKSLVKRRISKSKREQEEESNNECIDSPKEVTSDDGGDLGVVESSDTKNGKKVLNGNVIMQKVHEGNIKKEDENVDTRRKTEIENISHKNIQSNLKITAKYCICKTENDEGIMIECEKGDNCLSYLKQKRVTGAEGGNWFHIKCVNLHKIPEQRLENLKWFCTLCRPERESTLSHLSPKQRLESFLKLENRKLIEIKRDGNCMYSAMSVLLFGTPNKHGEVRSHLCSEFERIYKENIGKWSWNACPKDEECTNPLMHFIHKVVVGHRSLIDEKESDNDQEISFENVVNYLKKKKTPASDSHSAPTILAKYGSNIEMDLFSYLYKKNIWCIRPQFYVTGNKYNRKVVVTGYRWELMNTYVSKPHREHVEDCNYVTLLYEDTSVSTNDAHYTAVSEIEANSNLTPLPKCRSYDCINQNISVSCSDCNENMPKVLSVD